MTPNPRPIGEPGKQGGGELPLDFQVVDRVPTDPTKEIWEGELSVLGQKMALRFRVYDRDKHSRVDG